MDVSKIIDLMPPDFNYQLGTSELDGVPLFDPSITIKNGNQEQLTWNANPITTVAPGAISTLIFEAKATLQGGSYFNQLEVTVSGLTYNVFLWPTAQVEVYEVFLIRAVDTNGTTATSRLIISPSGPITDVWNITR